MRDDESDEVPRIPPPPHERSWRHPAEIAAQERTDIALAHPSPRLSRRATAVTAAASIVVSAAILSVVVPKGVDDVRTEAGNSLPSATTPPVDSSIVKGSLPFSSDLVAFVAGRQGEASVVALGEIGYLAAIDDIGALADSLTVSRRTDPGVEAVVRYIHSRAGVALLRTSRDPRTLSSLLPGVHGLRIVTSEELARPGYLATLSIVDHKGSQSFSILEGPVTGNAVGDFPVVTRRQIRGAAALVDADGTIVGAAVHCSHVTWILSTGRIASVLEEWSGSGQP